MKVIIIKDCKDGKVNDIVEVSDGYAKNFLIRNGYASSINSVTVGARKKDLIAKETIAKQTLENALKIKTKIENLQLKFELKVTNMIVHGSITRKQVIKGLKQEGIIVDNHAVQNIKIESTGTSQVLITLHKDVIAKLKVEVKGV